MMPIGIDRDGGSAARHDSVSEVVEAVATRTDGGLAVRARTAKTSPQVLAPDQLALASITVTTCG